MNWHIVEDNFFENPYSIRDEALKSIAERNSCILNDEIPNYPGARGKTSIEVRNNVFGWIENKMGIKVGACSLAYHITSRVHGLGLIHADFPPWQYAGVIYLNENPPENSGTIFCKLLPEIEPTLENFKSASTTKDLDTIKRFIEYKENYNNSYYEIELEIENKFNRLILYEGSTYHAPRYYFGNNLFNSRLVLVFWFNLV